VRHDGPHFTLDAIHLGEPSPQRTPVLYQAGTSTKGRQFAARHAECVFISGPSREVVGERVHALRRLRSEAGRDPASLKIFSLLTAIPGTTDAEARDQAEEYRSYVSDEGTLALVSGWTGLDLSRYGLDDPVPYERNNAGRSALEALTVADPSRVWTIREVAQFAGIGGIGPVVVGSASRVADEIQSWVEDTGVDGLNLAYAVTPESFSDFIDLVVPELQSRGAYKTAYQSGTLRRKLFGSGDRLSADHPAAGLRAPLPVAPGS
jgi:alkanesulfonate monooxygenase